MNKSILLCASLALSWCLLAFTGCGAARASRSGAAVAAPACSIALTPYTGEGRLDGEIARLQMESRRARDPKRSLEKLGWSYVEKARLNNDPGSYRLAEQCALCIESTQIEAPEALLLRGHALASMHRFKEAEPLARKLVAKRNFPFDYGLLGDVLMEQGRLEEAITWYQKMMDLKPGPQAYARAAHMRWLKGDLSGAIEMMRLSAEASGQGDPEAGAWAFARLALYELQAGNVKAADRACAASLTLQKDYAPALLALGRLKLASGKPDAAVGFLALAAKLSPLPEYQWTLAEALRSAGKDDEARDVEAKLLEHGAADDSRTFAIYLATKRIQVDKALRFAQEELTTREDVFSFDALAWAQAAAGRPEAAYATLERALSEGTRDARLLYHATLIAQRAGRRAEARRYYKQAKAIEQMLLPSEREHLTQQRNY
jgi:tetratricopeptide (TPR) repeat protein